MAKTAPDTFTKIGAGNILPLEPVTEGGAANKRGVGDVVRNLNHVTRSLLPSVVYQWCNDNSKNWLEETAVAAAGSGALRYVYRVPVWNNADLDTLQLRFAAYHVSGVAGSGSIRVQTGIGAGGATDIAVPYVAAPFPIVSGTVRMDVTAAAYDTVEVYTRLVSGVSSMRVKSVSMWQDRGPNPLVVDGKDVEPYEDDEPLATYMYKQLKDQTDANNAERRGVICNWSVDHANGSRSYYQCEDTTVTLLVNLPVRYGPLTSKLRIHINGWCDDVANDVTFSYRNANAPQEWDNVSFTLPTSGAYNAITSWVTDTIDVKQQYNIGTGLLEMTITSPSAGNPIYVTGISIWEEPI